MLQKCRIIATGLTLLLCFGLIPHVANAAQFNPDLITKKMCVTGADAIAFSQMVQQNGRQVRSLAAARQKVTLPKGDSSPQGSCIRMVPANERLLAHGNALPAVYAISLNAVSSYRSANAISDGLGFRDPNANAIIYSYGPDFVIIDIGSSSTSIPKHLDGCNGEAAYRVTMQTYKVYAFDDCFSPHDRVLPLFSQLPPAK